MLWNVVWALILERSHLCAGPILFKTFEAAYFALQAEGGDPSTTKLGEQNNSELMEYSIIEMVYQVLGTCLLKILSTK